MSERDYRLLIAKSEYQLQEKVKALLEEGWTLAGGCVHDPYMVGGPWAQALVFREAE